MCVAPLSLVTSVVKIRKNILSQMVKIVAEIVNNFFGRAIKKSNLSASKTLKNHKGLKDELKLETNRRSY